jgi:1-acyl-sn-glycerol-3-phosphate acyltransferase
VQAAGGLLPSPHMTSDIQSLEAQHTRFRVVLNRFLFRGMLFASGLVAIVLYRLDRELAWKFAKLQARNLARMCAVSIRIRGTERLTGGPYIFTPNHQSHFDIAALLGYLPGNNRFVAKRELFDEPILGAVMRTLGMIPIDRDDSAAAIERLRSLKDRNFSVIIFPEGTRSRDGELLPFKKGAFVAAIELGMPVVPVVCRGSAEVMPKGGYLSILPGEVEIEVLEPIETEAMRYEERDRLRDAVRERIAASLRA